MQQTRLLTRSLMSSTFSALPLKPFNWKKNIVTNLINDQNHISYFVMSHGAIVFRE